MDSKIKILTIVACAICAFLLPSCQQDNWMDWKLQNDIWLAQNAKKDSVRTTSTGLQYKIIADPLAGHDAKPKPTSTVVCDYTLELINGTVIESRENQPIYLSSAVPGFREGCIKVHTHGDIELFIPAYLGYDKSKYDSNDYNSAEDGSPNPKVTLIVYAIKYGDNLTEQDLKAMDDFELDGALNSTLGL